MLRYVFAKINKLLLLLNLMKLTTTFTISNNHKTKSKKNEAYSMNCANELVKFSFRKIHLRMSRHKLLQHVLFVLFLRSR